MMNSRKKEKRFILNLFQENCQEVQIILLETLGESMKTEKEEWKTRNEKGSSVYRILIFFRNNIYYCV